MERVMSEGVDATSYERGVFGHGRPANDNVVQFPPRIVFSPKFVYLAGPILHCTHDEANDWRRSVTHTLRRHGIIGVSPLRCEPLMGDRYEASNADPRFGTPPAIAGKNLYDVQTCDMTLAYLPIPPEGRHQSYGTLSEIAWAKIYDKRVIVVTDDPEIRNHPVIQASVPWCLDDLDQAIDVLVGVLGAYTGGKNV